MSAVVSRTIVVRNLPVDRRERILDAAEVCFVRNGFDRTTMQDMAREAAMSPANLYRYFDSKEALVIGLVEREGQHARSFITQLQRDGGPWEELMGVLDRYLIGMTRDAAVLRVDIWSEATRNPVIADLLERGDADAQAWFMDKFTRLAASPDCDLPSLYDAVAALAKGIVASRALLPDYDPAPLRMHLRAMIEAGLAGPARASQPKPQG